MTTDLRELMQERSHARPSAPDAVRLAQVHRRIARIRRRRTVGATALSLTLVVAGGVAVWPGRITEAPPPPAASPTANTIDGFPEYSQGGHVVATGVADLPQPSLTVTFVPRTLDLRLSLWCDPELTFELRVNGRDLFSGGCDATPDSVSFGEGATEAFRERGLKVGEPASFILTPTDGTQFGVSPRVRTPVPTSGRYALAIAETVDFASYPLPPRPDVLRPLIFEIGDRPIVARVDSDRRDVRRSVTTTLTYSETLQASIASQTPGFLRVTINGVPVVRHESWDYEAEEMLFFLDHPDLTLKEGDQITVTVEPQYVHGAWALIIHDST